MFKIPIDDMRYHTNMLTQKEKQWGLSTYRRVAARYPELPSLLSNALKPLDLSKAQKEALLGNVTVAFSHYAKISFPPKNEEELDKLLKKWLTVFVPYIAKNIALIHTTHPIQFEPIALANLFISNTLQDRLVHTPLPKSEDELNFWLIYEWHAFIRVLRSMMLLLTVGDDAHAMSPFRGILEIFSKLMFVTQFPEEYVLFKQFNTYLQEHKHNATPLPEVMTSYLKDEQGYRRNRESFLAYGWAKAPSGARILTFKELLQAAFPSYRADMEKLFHATSEFVHEAYAGVGYDYIGIRKLLSDLCFWMYDLLLRDQEILPFLEKKERARLCHLLSLTTPCYKGELQLESSC